MCLFVPPLHILVLYMLLIVFSTTNLADVVDLRGNSGAAIKHYLLVCVLGGLFFNGRIFTPVATRRGFCRVLCIVQSAVALSHSLTASTHQEYPGNISWILQHCVFVRLKLMSQEMCT